MMTSKIQNWAGAVTLLGASCLLPACSKPEAQASEKKAESSEVKPPEQAKALPIGVLIPGSKSDKGWMESGYDGLKRAEAKHGDKIKVTFVENVKFADMEQALTMLATKSDLVIGVGGQTQASVYKVAKRFPKIKFSIVGGNKAEPQPNIAQYDVRQAEIAFVAGAAAAMLSKTGGVSYVGGLEIPAIVNA